MEEVRYEDFLKRREEMEYEHRPLDDGPSTLTKGLIGVGLGAAALAIGYRSGGMRSAARFFNREGRALSQSVREEVSSHGPLLSKRGPRASEAGGSFARINQRRKELVESGRTTPPPGRTRREEYDMERYLRQREELIGEDLTAQLRRGDRLQGDVPIEMEEGLRLRRFMEEFDARHQDLDPAIRDHVQQSLAQGPRGLLKHKRDADFREYIKTSGISDSAIIDDMASIQNTIRGQDVFDGSPENVEWVRKMQEEIRDLSAGRMNTMVRKDGSIKRTIKGERQATIEDVLELHKQKKLELEEEVMIRLRDVMDRNASFKDAIFDKNLYIRQGKDGSSLLSDYKVFDDANRAHMEWWAGTIPGGLHQFRDILNIRDAKELASFRTFRPGSTQASLNAQMGLDNKQALTEPMVFVNGKFVRLFDEAAGQGIQPLNQRDLYLTSARFGTISKIHRQTAGMMTPEKDQNFLFDKMDLFNQERDAFVPQMLSVGTKFVRPDWGRNAFRKAGSGKLDDQTFQQMNRFFSEHTKGLDARALNRLEDQMPEGLRQTIRDNKWSYSNPEDMQALLHHMADDLKNRGVRGQNNKLVQLSERIRRRPDEVLSMKKPIGAENPILGYSTNVQTGQDVIDQEISLELMRRSIMRQIDPSLSFHQGAANYRQSLRQMQKENLISKKNLKDSEQLIDHLQFREASKDYRSTQEGSSKKIQELFSGELEHQRMFQESVQRNIKETYPLTQRHPHIQTPNQIKDEYVAVGKAFDEGPIRDLFSDKSVREKLDLYQDLFTKQMNPLTGRKNMEDFTTATIFGVNYPAYRMQDALKNLGLGLSDKSMSSGLNLWASLGFKRFFPFYGGAEAFHYADWQSEELTGESISQRYENIKANYRLQQAANLSEEEIEEMRRAYQLRPGIEHFEAMPETFIPGVGFVGFGRTANRIMSPVFGGAPLSEDDFMTEDEVLHDLEHGVEEIRQGRWWALGSKTPYRGGQIVEFQPNSYRLAHSNWNFGAESLTEEEHFRHHILPNPHNPLGAAAFLFGTRDPYYFEKKHYDTRPYLLTGHLFNSNTPVFGDVINATIGELIKPVREMHPEYWQDPVQMMASRPEPPSPMIRTTISSSGRMTHEAIGTPEMYGGYAYDGPPPPTEEGPVAYYYGVEESDTLPEGIMVISPYDQSTRFTPTTEINQHLIQPDAKPVQIAPQSSYRQDHESRLKEGGEAVRLVPLAAQDYQARMRPRSIYDEHFAYTDMAKEERLRNIHDPRGAFWRTQEFIENWTEPLGAYKWLYSDELIGREPYPNSAVIATADEAYNASNRYWDAELGSFGWGMSEIGRRFARRDSSQILKYNPIRNQMPDWLPEEFLYGDPYAQVRRGERRLPGEAYESLFELNPDEFGRYGAFDRFRILADVAPNSDEYRFWNQYVMDNEEDPDLRSQAAEIRRQVSRKRDRYDFTPYRFKHQEVEDHEVTVTDFLDDYTFLTKEFGDQAIRLAGVETRRNAEGVLQSFFDVGDQITIQIDADESQRISNDTYNTMRVNVLDQLGSINKRIIEAGDMQENWNDFSAPGVHARFTSGERLRGRMWEQLAHSSTPFNTKYLNARTPLEQYERDQIYGKGFADWSNFMIDGFLKPGLQMTFRHEGIVGLGQSALGGAFAGWAVSRLALKGGVTTRIGMAVGAAVSVGGNLMSRFYERRNDEVWIPKRRRIEHNINEYFDVLEHIKYERLYQQSRQDIYEGWGVDVEDLASYKEDKSELNRLRRRELEAEKQELYIQQPDGWEERRREINQQIEMIQEDNENFILPESILQSLYYRRRRDTTLVAVDPFGDRRKIMEALPEKDRHFFNEFVDAPERDRDRILSLVPENQRRIYKALWGRGLDDAPPLEHYFDKYNIPDLDWEGWSPQYNLDDVRTRVMHDNNLDLKELGIWNDRMQAAAYAPDLFEDGNDFNAEQQIDSFEGFHEMKRHMTALLRGEGYRDVDIQVMPHYGQGTQIQFEYIQNRHNEIRKELDQQVGQM